jgi:hypothetical protein
LRRTFFFDCAREERGPPMRREDLLARRAAEARLFDDGIATMNSAIMPRRRGATRASPTAARHHRECEQQNTYQTCQSQNRDSNKLRALQRIQNRSPSSTPLVECPGGRGSRSKGTPTHVPTISPTNRMELSRINATREPKKARNRCDLLSTIVGTSIHFTSRRMWNSADFQ